MISEGTHHELFQKLNLTPSISITRDLGQTAEVTGGERGLLVLIRFSIYLAGAYNQRAKLTAKQLPFPLPPRNQALTHLRIHSQPTFPLP